MLNYVDIFPKIESSLHATIGHYFQLTLLSRMSESQSGKREGLQDNATGKRGKFITDSSQGPLPHPMQWCRSESPEPKLLHKFIG